MSGWGSSSAWGNADESAADSVDHITTGVAATTINDAQSDVTDEPKASATFRNPQEHGWSSRTALDYVALAASRDAAIALEEADIIPTW